jgi:hypothetical protein
LRALNRVLLSLYEDVTHPEPFAAIIDLCESLLPVSQISVGEAELPSGRITHRAGRHLEVIPQVEEKMKLYGHQNPLIAYAQQGNFAPALRVSDFVSFREIKQTNFYQELAVTARSGVIGGHRSASAGEISRLRAQPRPRIFRRRTARSGTPATAS